MSKYFWCKLPHTFILKNSNLQKNCKNQTINTHMLSLASPNSIFTHLLHLSSPLNHLRDNWRYDDTWHKLLVSPMNKGIRLHNYNIIITQGKLQLRQYSYLIYRPYSNFHNYLCNVFIFQIQDPIKDNTLHLVIGPFSFL